MLMRTPPMRRAKPLGWDAPLSRVLAPAGARLTTLRKAGAYVSEHFATVTQSAVLERAIVLLMAAAESDASPTARPRRIRSSGCCTAVGCCSG
jgi:hypothetical protein